MTRFSPFDASLWSVTAAPSPETLPLNGEVRADVCIVGGGYTGLTTTLELARAGARVVLLEREELGFGGSGRNAGHCTPTFTHYSLPELRRMLGEPWAERLIRRQTRANDRAGQMIRDYGIDCEWVQTGYVMGALRPSQQAALREKTDGYNAVGARTRVLDRDEAQAITGSPRFFSGWLHEEGTIHTGSGVIGCERQGNGWRVKTGAGKVLADKVIFATGAYTVGGWPQLDRTFRIQHVFVAATEPLDPETRASVLPRNTTLHDGRGDIFVCKFDAAGRIVASMFPMGRRGRDLDYTRQVLTDRLRWLFPQITRPVRWEYLWFGELDMQSRTVPRLYGLAPGVVALTGLSGRGVPRTASRSSRPRSS